MSKRAVVLLSGGQDSVTCLWWAKVMFPEVLAVSFDYGQRHAAELEAAREIAREAGVLEHYVCEAPVLRSLGAGSALIDASKELAGAGGIPDAQMPQGLPTSFVPGRNLFFLTVAGMFAAARGARDVVTGVCQTDYSGYPDCRESFVKAMAEAVTQAMPSSVGPIRIHTPLMHLTKAETVLLAKRLGEGAWKALGKSVTCYEGKRPGCGACPSCTLRQTGFRVAGEQDPAEVL